MNERKDSSDAYWEARYQATATQPSSTLCPEWIERTLAASGVSLRPGWTVLEVGSGDGDDTQCFINAGCDVTALDFSPAALATLSRRFPEANTVCHALPQRLPFAENSFDLVIAGLSIHYFRWSDTVAIVQDFWRILKPSGRLLWRVNAVGDTNFGYGFGEEVEPHLFSVDGRLKRFFDRSECLRLFQPDWNLLVLNESVESKYKADKHAWEGVCERVG